jgi:hypothetical protein
MAAVFDMFSQQNLTRQFQDARDYNFFLHNLHGSNDTWNSILVDLKSILCRLRRDRNHRDIGFQREYRRDLGQILCKIHHSINTMQVVPNCNIFWLELSNILNILDLFALVLTAGSAKFATRTPTESFNLVDEYFCFLIEILVISLDCLSNEL